MHYHEEPLVPVGRQGEVGLVGLEGHGYPLRGLVAQPHLDRLILEVEHDYEVAVTPERAPLGQRHRAKVLEAAAHPYTGSRYRRSVGSRGQHRCHEHRQSRKGPEHVPVPCAQAGHLSSQRLIPGTEAPRGTAAAQGP